MEFETESVSDSSSTDSSSESEEEELPFLQINSEKEQEKEPKEKIKGFSFDEKIEEKVTTRGVSIHHAYSDNCGCSSCQAVRWKMIHKKTHLEDEASAREEAAKALKKRRFQRNGSNNEPEKKKTKVEAVVVGQTISSGFKQSRMNSKEKWMKKKEEKKDMLNNLGFSSAYDAVLHADKIDV